MPSAMEKHRHRDYGYRCRNVLSRVIEGDVLCPGHHQAADENQRRGGGEGGDRSGEWSEVQRRQEQHRHGDGNARCACCVPSPPDGNLGGLRT